MARKNIFKEGDAQVSADADSLASSTTRPLMGIARPLRPSLALGAISQSLDNMNARVRHAEVVERALAQGVAVVELDPAVIDVSIVPDRMEGSKEEHEAFVEAIRCNGQQVPILVRPKPGFPDRFEVAFGHRRLRAARDLGRSVRAIVQPLTDDALVIAQGQENSARTDLSFIERAHFAVRLEERRFRRETIMSALNVDKAALSRLITLASRVPIDVAEAVGPARSIGRIKWNQLADLLDADGIQKARTVIDMSRFQAASSDERFALLIATLKKRDLSQSSEHWTARDGVSVAIITRASRRFTLAFDERVAPSFGDFVKSRLQILYEDYQASRQNEEVE